ncbi:MAG: hypothetical protein NTZ16_10240 [Verrucomicrobia bacterium]|nr:hypothetical protein [Verrucomicrobiota bacterium]
MKFTLEVGEAEKHVVEFNFNQLAGNLVISVDNQPVIKSTRVFNEPLHEVFTIEVGGKQKSAVRIEKNRKQLFGHRNVVYVDNRLTRVVEG